MDRGVRHRRLARDGIRVPPASQPRARVGGRRLCRDTHRSGPRLVRLATDPGKRVRLLLLARSSGIGGRNSIGRSRRSPSSSRLWLWKGSRRRRLDTMPRTATRCATSAARSAGAWARRARLDRGGARRRSALVGRGGVRVGAHDPAQAMIDLLAVEHRTTVVRRFAPTSSRTRCSSTNSSTGNRPPPNTGSPGRRSNRSRCAVPSPPRRSAALRTKTRRWPPSRGYPAWPTRPPRNYVASRIGSPRSDPPGQRRHWGGLEPDRVGEHLVGQVTAEKTGSDRGAPRGASEQANTAALTVLARAVGHQRPLQTRSATS